jgi:hypothetical protein
MSQRYLLHTKRLLAYGVLPMGPSEARVKLSHGTSTWTSTQGHFNGKIGYKSILMCSTEECVQAETQEIASAVPVQLCA